MPVKDTDAFGSRMKRLEFQETERRFLPLLPIYARIDGRGFSKFTKGMHRPYDSRMTAAMVETTKYLVEHTHARIGYCQSDEISLLWYEDDIKASIFFDGKIMKLASVLAGMATAAFTRAIVTSDDPDFARYADRLPHFDARVISMPTRMEAANMMLWRSMDATKNAISMAASHYYSANQLHRKHGGEMQEMLFAKGVNFNDYPAAFKRGTFVRKQTVERVLTEAERNRIPDHVRPAPDQMFQRNVMQEIEMPIFNRVSNRVEVLFDAAEPLLLTEAVAIEPESPA